MLEILREIEIKEEYSKMLIRLVDACIDTQIELGKMAEKELLKLKGSLYKQSFKTNNIKADCMRTLGRAVNTVGDYQDISKGLFVSFSLMIDESKELATETQQVETGSPPV